MCIWPQRCTSIVILTESTLVLFSSSQCYASWHTLITVYLSDLQYSRKYSRLTIQLWHFTTLVWSPYDEYYLQKYLMTTRQLFTEWELAPSEDMTSNTITSMDQITLSCIQISMFRLINTFLIYRTKDGYFSCPVTATVLFVDAMTLYHI